VLAVFLLISLLMPASLFLYAPCGRSDYILWVPSEAIPLRHFLRLWGTAKPLIGHALQDLG